MYYYEIHYSAGSFNIHVDPKMPAAEQIAAFSLDILTYKGFHIWEKYAQIDNNWYTYIPGTKEHCKKYFDNESGRAFLVKCMLTHPPNEPWGGTEFRLARLIYNLLGDDNG